MLSKSAEWLKINAIFGTSQRKTALNFFQNAIIFSKNHEKSSFLY